MTNKENKINCENLMINSSMSVECAIAESQLGNCCVANRNKNQKAGLNDEPRENIELNRDKTELVNSVTELKSKVTELEDRLRKAKEMLPSWQSMQI